MDEKRSETLTDVFEIPEYRKEFIEKFLEKVMRGTEKPSDVIKEIMHNSDLTYHETVILFYWYGFNVGAKVGVSFGIDFNLKFF